MSLPDLPCPASFSQELALIQDYSAPFGFQLHPTIEGYCAFTLSIPIPANSIVSATSQGAGAGSTDISGEALRAIPTATVVATFSVQAGSDYSTSVSPAISLRCGETPCGIEDLLDQWPVKLPALEVELNDFAKAQMGTPMPTLELVQQACNRIQETANCQRPLHLDQSAPFQPKITTEVTETSHSHLAAVRFGTDEEARNYFSCISESLDDEESRSLRELQLTLIREVGDDVVFGTVLLDQSKMEQPTDQKSDEVSFDLLKAVSGSLGGLPCPASLADLTALYKRGNQSKFGVNGVVGDVLDTSKRSSREYPASHFQFRYPFDVFDFPDVAAKIKQTLCPTAEKIAIRPYKVILYQPGDFFSVHVDTMKHALQFGSLAVELPVDDDSFFSKAQGSDESDSGDLCFYIGRRINTATEQNGWVLQQKDQLLKNCLDDYDDVAQPVEDTSTLTRRMRRRRFRNCVRKSSDGNIEFLSLQYAAWRGDVHHELKKLTGGWRMVLIYRMFKVGEALLRIPMPRLLSAEVEECFSVIRAAQAKLVANPKAVSGGIPCRVRCLGFILRHQYPPAGLHPSGLKGIDAVVWKLCSQTRNCVLTPATEMQEGDPGSPFRLNAGRYGPHIRNMFLTADRLSRTQELSQEEAFAKAVTRYPLLVDCLWIQLGFGVLEGGGACFGNADCGTDWWYRTAVLIVTPEPSPFKRRLPAFLVGLRGPPAMQRLYQCFDVFQHMVGYL